MTTCPRSHAQGGSTPWEFLRRWSHSLKNRIIIIYNNNINNIILSKLLYILFYKVQTNTLFILFPFYFVVIMCIKRVDPISTNELQMGIPIVFVDGRSIKIRTNWSSKLLYKVEILL